MGNDDGRTEKKGLGYADPSIAAKQRELVDKQLAAMRAGFGPEHFSAIGVVLGRIRQEDGRNSFTLLDAGCGSAYYWEIMEYFAPGMIDYIGADFNPGMLALAGAHYPDLPLVKADVRNLEGFEDGQFDIVLSGATLMHIREWRKALKELGRVSRRWLILHRTWVHTDDTPTSREKRDAYGQQVWYYTFSESELMKQARKSGFDRVDAWPTGEGIRRGRVLTYLFRRSA